jgi:hypothetical protein
MGPIVPLERARRNGQAAARHLLTHLTRSWRICPKSVNLGCKKRQAPCKGVTLAEKKRQAGRRNVKLRAKVSSRGGCPAG